MTVWSILLFFKYMKNIFTFLLVGAIVVGGYYFVTNKSKSTTTEENITVTAEPTVAEKTEVPLPQEEDIIRTFFELINEQKPSDAIMMMAPSIINDDSIKQAYGVQFNAFQLLKIESIEKAPQSEWTDAKHTYRVDFEAKMKPEAAYVMPIPNYGYENGLNTRWVLIEKIEGKWKIAELSTGP